MRKKELLGLILLILGGGGIYLSDDALPALRLTLIACPVSDSHAMNMPMMQDALELFERPEISTRPSQLTFKPTPDDDTYVEDEYEFGRQITPFDQLPEPSEWVDRFIHSALEILNGKRSPVQLSRWCNRKVFAYLTENARARPIPIRVGRKRIGQPFDQTYRDWETKCVEIWRNTDGEGSHLA